MINRPLGQGWLEKGFRFKLVHGARLIFCGLLFTLSLPLYPYYLGREQEAARLAEIKYQKAVQFSADSLKREQLREDSLKTLLARISGENVKQVLSDLSLANGLVKNAADQSSFRESKRVVAFKLLNAEQYREALTLIKSLLAEKSEAELFYCRAVCYLKTDSIRLAVADLDSAKAGGYKPAVKLYNKVNPLIKHITGYCTLCADGTISYATGRGACSWHGGVAEWNHPMYETSRKYGND